MVVGSLSGSTGRSCKIARSVAASATQRDRPHGVETRGQRHDAGGGNAAERRFAADQPAIGCRAKDRAAGLRADRGPAHAGRGGRRRAAARSARRVREIPRIARWRRIEISELRRDGLAEDHRSRSSQSRDQRRIVLRDHLAPPRRAGHGRQAGNVDQVLDADGNSMQRPERFALSGLLLQALGRREGRRCIDEYPGM